MTLEYCANFCGNGVYQYFGVEYADEVSAHAILQESLLY